MNRPANFSKEYLRAMEQRSLTNRRDVNFPPVRGPAMFKEENSLPGAELHFAVNNGDGFTGACKDHPDV